MRREGASEGIGHLWAEAVRIAAFLARHRKREPRIVGRGWLGRDESTTTSYNGQTASALQSLPPVASCDPPPIIDGSRICPLCCDRASVRRHCQVFALDETGPNEWLHYQPPCVALMFTYLGTVQFESYRQLSMVDGPPKQASRTRTTKKLLSTTTSTTTSTLPRQGDATPLPKTSPIPFVSAVHLRQIARCVVHPDLAQLASGPPCVPKAI